MEAENFESLQDEIVSRFITASTKIMPIAISRMGGGRRLPDNSHLPIAAAPARHTNAARRLPTTISPNALGERVLMCRHGRKRRQAPAIRLWSHNMPIPLGAASDAAARFTMPLNHGR